MRNLRFNSYAGAALLAAVFMTVPAMSASVSRDEADHDRRLVSKAVPHRNGAPEVHLVPEVRSVKNTVSRPDPLEAWRNSPLSLLVHFGLHSMTAGNWKGEACTGWGSEMTAAHVFMDEYEALAVDFHPTDFDAEKIVNLARRADMRNVVFTAKHHDGFCMFRTNSTDFSTYAAPHCRRDFVAELSAACHRAGIGFGLWFSLNDWHHAQAAPATSHGADRMTSEHLRYVKLQLTELLSNYTRINEIWFEGGSLVPAQSRELYDHIKSLQPECLVGGLGNDCCDFATLTGGDLPDLVPDTAWQYADRLSGESWGYCSWEERADKDALVDACLKKMAQVLPAGGNYMLNVALNGYGGLQVTDAQVITETGNVARKLFRRPSFRPVPAEAVAKGQVLSRANATVSYGLSEVDAHLAVRSAVAYRWNLQDFGIRKVELQFCAEDIGTFVTLSIDGRSYDIELLPEQGTAAVPQLSFGHQQVVRLPIRSNVRPDSLARYIKEKKPYFLNVTAPEGYETPCKPMTNILMERTVSASEAGDAPVAVVSGDAVAVEVNGEIVTRHIHPAGNRSKGRVFNETVLLPLRQGPNQVLVRSYSRWGGDMKVAVLPAPDNRVYRRTFVIPDYIPGFRHSLVLSRKNAVSSYADGLLHNLRIVIR